MIDYGARLRAGILIPSGNSVAEPELRAMQVAGISLLVTRLSLRGSSKPELMRMLDRLEAASELLADAQVELHRVSLHGGVDLRARSGAWHPRADRGRVGHPLLHHRRRDRRALAQLKAGTVALLTPYIDDVHRREIEFLQANGFTRRRRRQSRHRHQRRDGDVAAGRHPRLGRRQCRREADACLISCTAIKSAPVIAPLEARLRPCRS